MVDKEQTKKRHLANTSGQLFNFMFTTWVGPESPTPPRAVSSVLQEVNAHFFPFAHTFSGAKTH